MFTSIIILNLIINLSGYEIMKKVHSRGTFKNMQSEVILTIESKRGKRIKKMKMYSKKKGETTYMLMRFYYPPADKGAGFLIIEEEDKDRSMWLYLPALRKVQRLIASGKAGSFMGSDFSNYDIGGGEFEDWNYKLIGWEKINGKNCAKIECIPKSKKVIKESGYSKMIKWVDTTNCIVLKTLCFNKAKKPFKEIKVLKYEKINGIWFETKMQAIQLKKNRKSTFEFFNINTKKILPVSIFTIQNLKRGK